MNKFKLVKIKAILHMARELENELDRESIAAYILREPDNKAAIRLGVAEISIRRARIRGEKKIADEIL